MKTLEEQIRALAAKGKITHISLTPDPEGRLGWRAVYAPSVGANVHAVHEDPVKAIQVALAGTPREAARATKPDDPRAVADELEFG